VVLLTTIFLHAQQTKISAPLRIEFSKNDKADFMVHLKDFVDFNTMKDKNGVLISRLDVDTRARVIVEELQNTARNSFKSVQHVLAKHHANFEHYWITNTIVVRGGSRDLVEELALIDQVDEIVLDGKNTDEPFEQKIYPIEYNVSQTAEPEFHVEWVKAPAVWKKGFTGQGIVVGFSDSGATYNHEAMVDAYRGNLGNNKFDHNYNWYDPSRRNPKVPTDTRGHGSHCTGIAVGGKNGRKIGVAPGAQWIHCHRDTESSVLKCLQWLLAPTDLDFNNPKPELRPHISSHSYTCPGCRDERGLLALINAGIAVVMSAGNSGPRCSTITSPAFKKAGYLVGALAPKSDNIASFSSRGPLPGVQFAPQISAPGQDITSCARTVTGYTKMSGTSMAAPNVAGVIALLWSAVPELKREINKTIEVLSKSALHQPSNECSSSGSPNNVFGHGTVNVEKAVELAKAMYGRKYY
jgi:subtilisin family serine protease